MDLEIKEILYFMVLLETKKLWNFNCFDYNFIYKKFKPFLSASLLINLNVFFFVIKPCIFCVKTLALF